MSEAVSIRFDVYGLELLVVRDSGRWRAYAVGEGKRRELHDLVVPPDVTEAELGRFLGDICHELATPAHPDVRRLPDRSRTAGSGEL